MTYRIDRIRFCIWFVSLAVGLPLISMLIARVTGIDLGPAAVIFIPMMLTAMKEGSRFVKVEGRLPTREEARYISLRLAGMGIAISAVLGLILFAVLPGVFALFGALGWGLALVVTFGLLLLNGRVFFGLGARTEAKVVAKFAGKDVS